MKKLIRKIAIVSFALSMSSTAFADDSGQPPPEDCYGYEVFGFCLTYEK